MVSEFVVVWFELNWLRNVAGSAFFVKGTPHGLAFQNGRIGMTDQELDELSALCCVKI